MNGFHNDTNAGRVKKILDLLGHMGKSAKSNRATANDWAEMLAPVIERIDNVTSGRKEPRQGGVNPVDLTTHPTDWKEPRRVGPDRDTRMPIKLDIREAAEKAPLKDLSMALAVAMNRFEEHFHEIEKRDH